MTSAILPPSTHSLRIALAQMDFPVGDITGNRDRIIQTIQRARDEFRVDLVVFPELGLSGPLPVDLLSRPQFINACETALHEIAENTNGITALVSWPQSQVSYSLSLLEDGAIQLRFCNDKKKTVNYSEKNNEVKSGKLSGGLDNYDSYFFHSLRSNHNTFKLKKNNKNLDVAILLCRDDYFKCSKNTDDGAQLSIIIGNNSFYYEGDEKENSHLKNRRFAVELLQAATKKGAIWLNAVGGQDGVIFDGGSVLIDADGKVHPPAAFFEEHLLVVDYDINKKCFTPLHWPTDKDTSEEALIWKAITRGIADYCRKNNFQKVWLGLSGGIDSALVLALAVDALGADNVRAVSLPSRHTLDLSNDLAVEQCRTLGVQLDSIPIEPAYRGFLQALGEIFEGLPIDVTEENLQSRCRGAILMALTNKFGGLLLSTGNKSEYAVGYATIYGDMCGGYAPLKDLYKTQVYKLCRWRNAQAGREEIPQAVIDRAPSAELRDNQKDQDSLPPYEILDAILYRYIELNTSKEAIIDEGFNPETVERVLHLVRSSEWKRHQAAPGPKLSRRAFGTDWHYPISNAWRD